MEIPRVAVLAAVGLLAGCPRSGAPATPRDRPADLAALADRIDPGRVPPLLADPPASIERLIGERPAAVGGAARAEAEAALAAFAGQLAAGGGDLSLGDLQRILKLFYAVALVEEGSGDRCDLACLTALERVYGILDIPWLAAEEGLMAQMIDIASGALIQAGFSKREVKEAIAFIRSVFRRAPERHAMIAARLFRRHPDSPAAQSALRRIGNRAANDEDFARAITFLATAAARAPRAERAGDLVDLARACYRALDLACGDRHLAEARRATGADPAMAERLTGAQETARLARAVRRAAGVRGFEARIERAHLLLDLGRRRKAIAVFEQLRRQRPKDARPLVGLAESEMDTIRGSRVRGYLRRAAGLENLDLRYYELAIGTAFTEVMPIIQEISANPDMPEEQIALRLAAPLAPLRSDIDGLARFAPSRAAVLRVVIDGAIDIASVRKKGDAAMKAALARAWRAGLEVRRRFPAESDAHHLVYLMTGAGPAPLAELEAAVLAELPADLSGLDKVLVARAGVYLRLVLVGTRLDHLDRLGALIAAVPASQAASWEVRNLRADLAALSAIAGTGSWGAALAAYRELVSAAPDDPERARVENNIGVALHRGGDLAGAQAAWDRSMRLEPAYPVADLNHAAAGDGAPYGLERLSTLAGSAELAGLGFQAAAWRRHFGVARGERGQKTLAALRAEAFDTSFGLGTDGGLGFISAGSFKISFGYHSTKRLVIELGTESKSWLCLPAPGTAPKR